MIVLERQPLTKLDNVKTSKPIGTAADIVQRLSAANIRLPHSHIELLAETDGCSAYGGFFRLFGIGDGALPNLVAWNDPETWKFAWGNKAAAYIAFGTTAWGDQYAYHAPDGQVDDIAPVFLMDAFTMEVERLSDDFDAFLKDDFQRNALEPYDSMVPPTRTKLGDLTDADLLAFQPPLQLGGTEMASSCVKLPARSVMIANGDLSTGLEILPETARVAGVEPYVDEKGRSRLRLVTVA
jgi:hypothetical protein